MVKAIQVASLEFTKNQDESYFELLRLATVTDSRIYNDTLRNYAITVFNQLPNYLASQKRLMALLLHKAKTLNVFEKLTTEVQQLLTLKTQQAVITELGKKDQLNRVLKQFSSNNIAVILLKGSAFSGVLYTNESPRSSSDIDILVKEQDWEQAKNCLRSLMKQENKAIDGVFADLYEVTFKPTNNSGAVVDLHKALVNPILFNINEDDLWKNSMEHPSYNNNRVRMLMPEHALIHQALHAYKDMDFAKYNLVDAHEIISTQAPSINNTIAIAKAWGATVPLYVLLKNCVEVMSTNVNQNFLAAIRPNAIRCEIIKKLVKSSFIQPINNKKPLRYRVNQLIGQFMFTGSVKKILALQGIYLKLSIFSSKKNFV